MAFTYLIVADAVMTWTIIIAAIGVVAAMNIGSKMVVIRAIVTGVVVMVTLAVLAIINLLHGLNKMVAA